MSTPIVAFQRRRHPVLPVISCFTLLNACAALTPAEVVDPEEVTVSEALEDIGKGFSKMDTALGETVLGLYPCEVKVTLNLKVSAKDTGKLVIDVSSKPGILEGHSTPVDPATKTGIEKFGEAVAERGNTIDLRLYNPSCLPKGTLGYEKPDAIGQAREGMAFTGEERAIVNLLNKIDLGKLQPVPENWNRN